MKKQIQIVIVGCGNRAKVYCEYAIENPDQMNILAVVDPNEYRMNLLGDQFSVEEHMRFSSLDDFLSKKIEADAVVNGTMDQQHYETAIPILEAGYNMLLEKPITVSKEKLLHIYEVAKQNNSKVMVCHVLRYAPFYVMIKERIINGEIGDIINIVTEEDVSYHHMATAFVRGKWGNSDECGSEMLMAKCCHDLDIITWMKSGIKPTYVSSLGGRHLFTEENAPKNAGTKCMVDCELVETCPYSAKKMYLDAELWQYYTHQYLDKFDDKDSYDRYVWSLKENNPYGRCVYKCNNNVVDRQAVIIEFEDGCIVNHNLITGTAKPTRTIHITGTKGEIYGDMEEECFYIRKPEYDKSKIKVDQYSEVQVKVNASGMHGGGDQRLAADFVNYINGSSTSISTTTIKDSIFGHIIGFEADVAMKEKKVVKIDESIL